MTFTSIVQPNSKTAEFSRLFDLFDRVATRRRNRALTGDTSEVISADDIANVPAEFAPVLKNLSTILSSHALRDEEHARRVQVVSTPKPRHGTNNSTGTPSATPAANDPTPRVDKAEESFENAIFPLGERYPFTFKLMLHKLYDLDEWAEKVKNAVETSKSQFKPLAERVHNVVRDASTSSTGEREKRSGARPVLGSSAKFKPPSTIRQAYSRSAVTARDATTVKERAGKWNNARPVLGTSAKFKPPPSSKRHPRTAPKLEASRVLKKRCVGRRKSISGPTSNGAWVYDAAVSATVTEVSGPRPAVEITLSAPRDAGSVFENRARHRSLNALEDMHGRGAARRKVKITVPLAQESAESAPVQISREVTAMESMVKRKKSLVSIFASETCRRVAVKRPLCV